MCFLLVRKMKIIWYFGKDKVLKNVPEVKQISMWHAFRKIKQLCID